MGGARPDGRALRGRIRRVHAAAGRTRPDGGGLGGKRQNLLRKELAWLRRGAPARTRKPKFRIDAANALIDDEPPLRDPVAQSMAMARLGKDVVDLFDVSVSYDDRPVLRDIEWRIAPGERTGILGVNGAGKSTLLGLIAAP